MRTILSTIALFSLCGLFAQEYVPTHGRELPRGGLLVYPSAEAATAADGGDNRYFTRLTEWNLQGNVFSTDFTVPFAWANRQVLFHLGWASGDYEVRVNGRPAAYNADGNHPGGVQPHQVGEGGIGTRSKSSSHSPPHGSARELEGDSPARHREGLGDEPADAVHPRHRHPDPACRGRQRYGRSGVVLKSNALNPRTSRIHYELLTPTGERAAAGP